MVVIVTISFSFITEAKARLTTKTRVRRGGVRMGQVGGGGGWQIGEHVGRLSA